jgi:hypothetical protein
MDSRCGWSTFGLIATQEHHAFTQEHHAFTQEHHAFTQEHHVFTQEHHAGQAISLCHVKTF